MNEGHIDRIAWTLIHSLWQGALVSVLLAIALGFAYRASSRVRYGLGCVALTLLVLLPFFTYLSLDRRTASIADDGAPETTVIGALTNAGATAALTPKVETKVLDSVVLAWLVGVALLSLRLVGSLLQIERWRRRHTWVDHELARRVHALAQRLGIITKVRVLVADQAVVPCAWGILRPAIVVPASLVTGLPPLQLEAILLHELAHIRRFDYLVNVLQTFVEIVLFYHPATWWISSLVRREREHCCDDIVVAALGDPLPYARALLQLEERRHSLPRPALSARGGTLMNRIQRILSRPTAPSRLLPTASAVATISLIAATVGGAIQAQTTSQATPKSVATKASSSTIGGRSAVEAATRKASTRVAQSERALKRAQAELKLAKSQSKSASKIAAAERAVLVAATAAKQARGAAVATKAAETSRPGASKRGEALAQGNATWAGGKGSVAMAAESAATRSAGKATRAVEAVAEDARAAQATSSGEGVAAAMAAPAASLGEAVAVAVPAGSPGQEVTRADEDLKITLVPNGKITLDAKMVTFSDVARKLAIATGKSFVIEAGEYKYLNVVLSDVEFPVVLDTLCRAAGAGWTYESGVYIIAPKNRGGGLGGGAN